MKCAEHQSYGNGCGTCCRTGLIGYLRKSTRGKSKGKERQEKSLSQQKREIALLGKRRFKIVAWYRDDGISGWKRGAQRPGFQRMLEEVQKHGAEAVLCDNIDRFSRATVDEVQIDSHELRRAGVRWIVTASHGEYDLGARHDIGDIIKFVVAVWAANEYSRQLGRRIALARRNGAQDGKRTGGAAPYGYANDKDGGLTLGEPAHVKIVRQIFEWFESPRSLNSIADKLNRANEPAPRGGKWLRATVRDILARRAYRGDFVFNHERRGQFFQIGADGEVCEAAGKRQRGVNDAGVFVTANAYPPLIEAELFDRVQARLALLKGNRGRRKRMGYPLTGILICDSCGKPLYGCKPNSEIVYRCGTGSVAGCSACPTYSVRQSEILPFLMRLLGEEVDSIKTLLVASDPPAELRWPNSERTDQREQAVKKRAKLAVQIAKAEENLLFSEDERTRKSLDTRVTEMRDELELLDAELAVEVKSKPDGGYSTEDLAALNTWWAEFDARAVSVPWPRSLPVENHLHQDSSADEAAILADSRIVNETLHALGAEVRLRWLTEEYLGSGGVKRRRYVLTRGRFRLGQQSGKVPKYVLDGTVHRPSKPFDSAPWRGPESKTTQARFSAASISAG